MLQSTIKSGVIAAEPPPMFKVNGVGAAICPREVAENEASIIARSILLYINLLSKKIMSVRRTRLSVTLLTEPPILSQTFHGHIKNGEVITNVYYIYLWPFNVKTFSIILT